MYLARHFARYTLRQAYYYQGASSLRTNYATRSVTIQAYCYRPSSVVCQFVCRSVTLVCSAKTAEAIEMPFGLRTRVGSRNHVLDQGPLFPWDVAILMGKGASHCKVQRHSAVICAKTAEPIDVPFGLWTRIGRKKYKFNRIRQVALCARMGWHSDTTWRIRLDSPSAAAMQLYVNLF